jgi:hypothetical protein
VGCILVSTSGIAVGQTTRVSVDSNGNQGNAGSFLSALSADARFVAFESSATNLVTGDTNGFSDIFVRDRATGQTTRVSVDSSGTQANDDSFNPAISANGRFVAFASRASNLVAGDTNASGFPESDFDTFVHDRLTGQTVRVNVDSAGQQANATDFPQSPSLSADGRFVAFSSFASNLVAGDTNSTTDVFVRDLQTGQTTRVSVDSNGVEGDRFSDVPSISTDGRYVAFRAAASNLVPGDTNFFCDRNGDGMFIDNCMDVFVHDRQTGQTTRVSVDSQGTQGNSESYPGVYMAISADGRFVVFNSESTNLVPGDTNGIRDFFVHDRLTGETTRVSVDSAGNQATTVIFSGAGAAISADGRFVAFEFDASFVPEDTGITTPDVDVYVHDRLTGETKLVSVDSAGNEGNRSSSTPSISADGRFVSFVSFADNLVPDDTNGAHDVFVHDNTINVTLQIGPSHSINPRSNGVLPVAILTTPAFDAASVDVSSVLFGSAGATEAHGTGHLQDVDGDGDVDLLLHFETPATGIACGDTSASLTGQTVTSLPIIGSVTIVTVGCH